MGGSLLDAVERFDAALGRADVGGAPEYLLAAAVVARHWPGEAPPAV